MKALYKFIISWRKQGWSKEAKEAVARSNSLHLAITSNAVYLGPERLAEMLRRYADHFSNPDSPMHKVAQQMHDERCRT